MRFCANKKCLFHTVKQWQGETAAIRHGYSLRVEGPRELKTETRRHHLYKCSGYANFYLCDVCHEAVQLIEDVGKRG